MGDNANRTVWIGKDVQSGNPIVIETAAGLITAIRPYAGMRDSAELPWISPGWIDLQVNGYGGYDFNSEQVTEQQLVGATAALQQCGVALYLPTVITGHPERMRQGLRTIADYAQAGRPGSASIMGIHLEGPYLSEMDGPRGAHPREHIADPDWESFMGLQEAAQGLIRMVTLAPERSGAIPFIRQLVREGITVAIGHTRADADQLARAVEAGAAVSTHLGNGSDPLLPRHPNYIWEQLAEDRLWATFIPDGHHLAPSVLKVMLRAKGDKAILVSDCVKFGGMPPGRYESLIGGSVELHASGRLNTLANPAILAGSAYSLDRGLATALQYTDMKLPQAIAAVTARPAQLMGCTGLGRMELGSPAHLTLFHYDAGHNRLSVQETVVAGRSVYVKEGNDG